MSPEKPTIYLVDSYSFVFRAFYAVAPLSTAAGFPTNALFGFTKMMVKLLGTVADAPIAAVFDFGDRNFRDDLFEEYKAHRAETPADLVPQLPYFPQICEALGITVLRHAGVEADDVIATIATALKSQYRVVIVSSDKDLMQLVEEHADGGVMLWDTMKDIRYDSAQVTEKFGVPPSQVRDYLALIGDSSDNVPGVAGVGPKTAVTLLQEYKSLEGVLSHLAAIKENKAIRGREKLAATLEQESAMARLSYQLVGLKTDVAPFNDPTQALTVVQRRAVDYQLVQKLIKELEFDSLLRQFVQNSASSHEQAAPIEIHQITAPAQLQSYCGAQRVVFYAESSGVMAGQEQYFAEFDGRVVAIPCAESNLHQGLAQAVASAQQVVAHGAKSLIKLLLQQGCSVDQLQLIDTEIVGYLIDSEQGDFSLATLVTLYLHQPVPAGAATLGVIRRLAEVLQEHLAKKNLTKVYREIEAPLIAVLASLELVGVKIDTGLLKQLSEETGAQLQVLESQLRLWTGAQMNLNSPKQLAEVLFEKLKLPTKGLKKTKTGISTDAGVLEKLAEIHEFPRMLLQYRALFKLKSTYLDALPTYVDPHTQRLHTTLHQAVTGTGRLSSSNPNLQNIPIRTKEGRRIREAFIAEDGWQIISADYSQIELRVLAHMSGDPQLQAAFAHGEDIHAHTAARIFGVASVGEVTPEQRRVGKTINFGVVYGMGPHRLAKELEIEYGVAARYIEDYFSRHAKVRELFDDLERQAAQKGYVETFFGRRRNISALEAAGRDQGFLARAAINAPVQGTAADVIKLAMVRVQRALKGLKTRMILQIHDELLFEAPIEEIAEAQRLIRHEMTQVVSWSVPLEVDCQAGRSWAEAHG